MTPPQPGQSDHEGTIHVPAMLSERFGIPRSQARMWIAQGIVRLNDGVLRELDIPDPGPSARWSVTRNRETG